MIISFELWCWKSDEIILRMITVELIILTFTESSRAFGKNRLKPTSFLKTETYRRMIRRLEINSKWKAQFIRSQQLLFPSTVKLPATAPDRHI